MSLEYARDTNCFHFLARDDCYFKTIDIIEIDEVSTISFSLIIVPLWPPMRTNSGCLPIPQICDRVLIKKKEHEPYYRIQKRKRKKENGMTGRESNTR